MVIALLKEPHTSQMLLIHAMKVTFWWETRTEHAMATGHGQESFQNVNVSYIINLSFQ